MMTIDPIGLYIHIPYCVRKCKYCDFCSVPKGAEGVPDAYVERLTEEIRAYRKDSETLLSTVYFGGGTPSLLSPEQFEKIISAVKYSFNLTKNVEFSMEMNPGTVTEEKLVAYRSLGVNRVSVGLQSAVDSELEALGRIHTYNDFLETYRMLRECGFDNVNVDVMYGIPYETLGSFRYTLERVIDLSPEHISVYGLIVEEGTPFGNMRDRLPLPNEATECDMYYLAAELLSRAGYSHYEISNYAKQGYESRHNLKYWRAEQYIGVGASAASYFDGKRYSNTTSVSEYISSHGIQYNSVQEIDTECERFEYAMMRLRLSEGISLEEYKSRFGIDFLFGKRAIVGKLVSLDLLRIADDRLSLTERGFYVSNAILTEIL